jgi:molecular chaperone Hsp31 and glyoxalase 3
MRTPISPQLEEDGTYRPSRLAMRLATQEKTDYDGHVYPDAYQGDSKILMICTEQKAMTMANGKKFSTGNHPVEMLVPMLHLRNAGFDIEIATPTGAPVQIEMWAMPQKDEAVMGLYAELKHEFENPRSLTDFVEDSMTSTSPYCAVFLPGGHGAMLGLPENVELGKILNWAHDRGLHTLALCHGPAALLAANLPEARGPRDSFVYDGYELAAFPDAVDKQTPMIGYMPGHMPWRFGERLADLGATIINKKSNGTVHIDRTLVTGDGPKAANAFGRLAATTLLETLRHSDSAQ